MPPIFCGCDSDLTLESAPQGIGIRESAASRHLLGRLRSLFQESSRSSNSDALDPRGRRDSDLGTEEAGKVTRRNAHALCHLGHSEIGRWIVRRPALNFLQGRSTNQFRLLFAAELHLTAWTLEEHDELARDSLRDFSSKISLDKRESQIQPRRYAGSRPETAIPDVYRALVDGDGWESPCKPFSRGPVRRYATTIKQTRRSENERASAD
jgi:hypothetical protein